MTGSSSDSTPMRPPIILAVDSQEWTLRSFESVIGPRGYAVTRAYTGKQGLGLLRAIRPDAILVGAHLADMTILSFLEQLRATSGVSASLPILVTTSGVDVPGHRVELLRAGAWTVITPAADPESFVAQLEVFVRSKMESDRLREAALLDEETGFYSLRGLAHRAREVAADAYRRSAAVACIVVSPAQDEGATVDEAVIRELAEALRRISRGSDLIGRVGANQFAIVATADGVNGMEAALGRLQQALQETPATSQRTAPLAVGISQIDNYRQAALPVDDLLRRAAQSLAMFRAGKAGPLPS
ncbi:MAG: diguanylate cyclase [Gemmatimonadaceae bacterium]|nr:diguanylate cyclase [Gemmatimonadaceae bacterium]